MDTVSTHEVSGCKEKIIGCNTVIEWIPGGYTWKLQPLDVGLNRVIGGMTKKSEQKPSVRRRRK